MDQAVADVVKEIEEEKALGRVSGVSVFRNMLNQPALMSISSVNAQPQESGDGFSSFVIDLPRPLLSVKALEMLTCNMPLCTQNIPDTACAFWYYRLSLYSGKYPNANNLFWVRLLPSYYKPEFIRGFEFYGYNQTFNGYADVATQLSLATSQDLAQVNFADTYAGPPYYRIQYLPDNEVQITYDSAINKFKFAGNFGLPYDETSPDPEPIVNKYAVGTTYALGAIVKNTVYVQGEGFLCYESLTAGNVGNPLPVYPAVATNFWIRNFNVEGVAPFSATTAYRPGQYVEYQNVLYECLNNSFGPALAGGPPPANFTNDPALMNGAPFYRYLATGPLDPEVAFMQGTGQRKWNEDALFEAGDNVIHKGVVYTAFRQTLGTEPFPVPNPTDNTYSATRQYQVGDYVYLAGTPGVYYVNILASKGISPTFGYFNNANWNHIEYDTARPTGSTPPASQFYQVGDIVRYITVYPDIPFFKCIKAFPPANSINTGGDVRFGLNEYWAPTYWTTGTPVAEVPYVGLAKISADLDMLDELLGTIYYPFPVGIPPQPFNPNPKRLLNSILGFTWNGKFVPNSFSVIYDEVAVTDTTATTQLLNRLRPVPVYATYLLSGTSAPGSVEYDPTFTANAYGNLVYSSIVNVYASIAGAKSLDTQRNTNLIGTMTASAGNLGIAFAASFIDTPLDQYDGDIYSITFSFTDEYGEPYPFTNNAVVSMTFRMRYKSDD
jgi:hypothetical protein